MCSDFDIRMKENYEKRSRAYLTRRVPVIIRVDGKAFHTFCKRFEKPYDEFLNESLNSVLQFLCENIQGAKFGERHSDELSILVTDFNTLQTDAYFEYEVQKICSITASMATAEFCRILTKDPYGLNKPNSEARNLHWDERWPNFDSRCFNIPEAEIANYFWWRMLDAKRGSINMTAQANFSHKELQGLSCDQMQEKLWQERGINWGTLPQGQKIGFICRKVEKPKQIPNGPKKGEVVMRNIWEIEVAPASKTELDEVLSTIKLVKEG